MISQQLSSTDTSNVELCRVRHMLDTVSNMIPLFSMFFSEFIASLCRVVSAVCLSLQHKWKVDW